MFSWHSGRESEARRASQAVAATVQATLNRGRPVIGMGKEYGVSQRPAMIRRAPQGHTPRKRPIRFTQVIHARDGDGLQGMQCNRGGRHGQHLQHRKAPRAATRRSGGSDQRFPGIACRRFFSDTQARTIRGHHCDASRFMDAKNLWQRHVDHDLLDQSCGFGSLACRRL